METENQDQETEEVVIDRTEAPSYSRRLRDYLSTLRRIDPLVLALGPVTYLGIANIFKTANETFNITDPRIGLAEALAIPIIWVGYISALAIKGKIKP